LHFTRRSKVDSSKAIFSVLVGALASIGALFVILIFIFGDSPNSCGKNSDSVVYARGLSKERLAKLYYDMEKLSDNSSTEIRVNADGKFPEPFADIQAVKIRPNYENIMLQGCFDHAVSLNFHGFQKNRNIKPNRQIILRWGEPENSGSEVIWSE
jgi:hypothetical protein